SECESCATSANPDDSGVLDVRYDYESAGDALRAELAGGAAPRYLFRYWPLMPLGGPIALPGSGAMSSTGGTPCIEAPPIALRLGLGSLWSKDETANPSGCLKDRATAVAIERASARGVRDLCCASAGNAALSLARFCAEAGLACHVFVPASIDS